MRWSVWQALVHVARSERGAACVAWQVAQPLWPAATWSAGSVGRAWHELQVGAVATPPGPCGRWQLAQPPGRLPCLELASLAWQLAQVAAALRAPSAARGSPCSLDGPDLPSTLRSRGTRRRSAPWRVGACRCRGSWRSRSSDPCSTRPASPRSRGSPRTARASRLPRNHAWRGSPSKRRRRRERRCRSARFSRGSSCSSALWRRPRARAACGKRCSSARCGG